MSNKLLLLNIAPFVR